jgi:hypothetical protein
MNTVALIVFHARQTAHMAMYFLNRRRLNQFMRLLTGRSRRTVPVTGGGRWR